MTQVPPGSKDLVCPLHRKTMNKVCHTCPWWAQLHGKDAKGNPVDGWQCSIAALPALMIENARQSRSNAAATESFRNAMLRVPVMEFARQAAIRDQSTQEVLPLGIAPPE